METRNVLSYVERYLVRKARLSCSGCRTALLKEATVPLADVETFIALKSYTAITPNDAGSLLRPKEECDACIVACYKQFKQQVQTESVLLESSLCKRLVNCVMAMSEAQHLTQLMCHPDVLRGCEPWRQHTSVWSCTACAWGCCIS